MNTCRSNYFVIKSLLLGSIVGTAFIIVAMRRHSPELNSIPDRSYFGEDHIFENTTDSSAKRSKRFIVYNGVGVVKLVMGASFPIILADKKRSLNMFYNFQMQYTPSPIPLYWWNLYNTTTFAARKRRSMDMLREHDNSRSRLYEFIETMFQSSSSSDKTECLLKAICEMARAPLSEISIQRHLDYYYETETAAETEPEYTIGDDYGRNIYHKLINVIFTPHLPNVDRRYLNAHIAGSNGANCGEIYAKCDIIDELLKRFTRFI